MIPTMRTAKWLAALLCLHGLVGLSTASAQTCPPSPAALRTVRNAVSDLQNQARAPAGAKCAFDRADNYAFTAATLSQEEIDFFDTAADVQRRASEIRASETPPDTAMAEKYLDQEIALRRRFLEKALKEPESPSGALLRAAVVKHLSSLVNAMAMRRQYQKAAEYLEERPPNVIDDAALKVWLQAVWSCAKWDGTKANICSPAYARQCSDRISNFLDSVAEMKNRNFPRQAKRDIAQLKSYSSTGGCLKLK